jgi:hypothetical protein
MSESSVAQVLGIPPNLHQLLIRPGDASHEVLPRSANRPPRSPAKYTFPSQRESSRLWVLHVKRGLWLLIRYMLRHRIRIQILLPPTH